MGEEPEMGGWEIFKVSLHNWQSGTNPLSYDETSILPTLPFFKFCPED